MKTIRTEQFWDSTEGDQYIRTHLPEVYHLDKISNWVVFGTITFKNKSLRHYRDNPTIKKRIHKLLHSFATALKIRLRHLVFFYSIEGDGIHRPRHIHLLIASDRLENVTPEVLCRTCQRRRESGGKEAV